MRQTGRPRYSQGGSSLIEILVATTIMGSVVMGIAAGYLTTVRVSGRVGELAETEATLVGITESVGEMPYRKCATLPLISSDFVGAVPVPAGYRAEVRSIRYLTSAGTSFAAGACTKDRGAELLTIEVAATDPGASAVTGEVVLRDEQARPG